ncbi:MAG: hypothetical protein ACRECL_16525 [Bradyrhizobium sp.]
MQAPLISPLLMSMLARAISWFAGDGPGGIASMVLPIFAGVQAIIAAEAGARARTERTAAVINILISSSPGIDAGIMPDDG